MIDIHTLTVERLAGMIDHTFLKPFGGVPNIEKLCAEARRYNLIEAGATRLGTSAGVKRVEEFMQRNGMTN